MYQTIFNILEKLFDEEIKKDYKERV